MGHKVVCLLSVHCLNRWSVRKFFEGKGFGMDAIMNKKALAAPSAILVTPHSTDWNRDSARQVETARSSGLLSCLLIIALMAFGMLVASALPQQAWAEDNEFVTQSEEAYQGTWGTSKFVLFDDGTLKVSPGSLNPRYIKIVKDGTYLYEYDEDFGTKFSPEHKGCEYARIDKKGKPGYFTLKK